MFRAIVALVATFLVPTLVCAAPQSVAASPPPPGAAGADGVGRSAVTVPPDATQPKAADLLDHGHAEFAASMRRFMWQDPMIRLQYGLDQAAWDAQRGGIKMAMPYSIAARVALQPGVDPRLVLSGPFAADWNDLTPQEKIGRIAEDVTYAGLVIGLLSALAHR